MHHAWWFASCCLEASQLQLCCVVHHGIVTYHRIPRLRAHGEYPTEHFSSGSNTGMASSSSESSSISTSSKSSWAFTSFSEEEDDDTSIVYSGGGDAPQPGSSQLSCISLLPPPISCRHPIFALKVAPPQPVLAVGLGDRSKFARMASASRMGRGNYVYSFNFSIFTVKSSKLLDKESQCGVLMPISYVRL